MNYLLKALVKKLEGEVEMAKEIPQGLVNTQI